MFSVLKFGGSSVASATNISRVLDIVGRQAQKGKVVLVSSAISGCTDALLKADEASLTEMEKRHRSIVTRLFTGSEREQVQARIDTLFGQLREAPDAWKVTFGELFSTTILEARLAEEGWDTVWLDSRELVVKDREQETFRRIRAAVESRDAQVYVAPGFICRDEEGRISTLGRGGSDYSAALYAAAIGADSLQIWTDVPGIMTANPKQVPAARTIPRMSYGAALEMASHGAKVLYAPTVAPAMAAGIDIEIRNSFDPEGKYTVIGAQPDLSRWIGVTSEGEHIRLVGAAIEGAGSVAQGARSGTEGAEAALEGARSVTEEAEAALEGARSVTEGAEAALEGARSALEDARAALEGAGIAAVQLSADGPSLDIRVRKAVLNQALKALHRAFFQEMPVQEINLFIAGNGAVARALMGVIAQSGPRVAERTGKQLRIVGLADSRKWGIDMGGHPVMEQEGDYIDAILQQAPKGSLFIDVTNSKTLHERYTDLLEAGIGIVSSNRRSLAVPYAEYAAMHSAARENGSALRYETTVGAALPMLESIARGTNSCDEVLSIEAVVSCTLNQILGDYRPGGESFASLVRKAQAAGLTETDPRTDLGGEDALRKLLILAREAGVPLEAAQVEVVPVVPATLFEGSAEDFYKGLEAYEPELAAAARTAELQGFRRRFVASLEKTDDGYHARIGIRNVPPVHPAYHLRGTENAIIVRSAFHPYPLVIEGPGEGPREAASSILNDILR